MIRDYNYENVTVIGHSADDDVELKNEFFDSGADFFEVKPLERQRIEEIMKAIIEKLRKRSVSKD